MDLDRDHGNHRHAGRTAAQGRPNTDELWQALPAVIHAAFECVGNVPVHQSLYALGVEVPPSETVEWGYETEDGPLVVTVWHDQIEREADGSFAYWIDAFTWRPHQESLQADHLLRMHEILDQHVGQDVYVLIMKRGRDASETPRDVRNAPDVVMWRLEAAGQNWFVLRRPMTR